MDLTSVQSKGATPVSGPARATVPPQQAAQQRALIKAADVINANQTFGTSNSVVFVFDRDTHRPVMRVVDNQTNEVLMQLPPQYVLNLAAEAEAEERKKQDQSTKE
jgi:uncharacterized FlaG/YvyC family protein